MVAAEAASQVGVVSDQEGIVLGMLDNITGIDLLIMITFVDPLSIHAEAGGQLSNS